MSRSSDDTPILGWDVGGTTCAAVVASPAGEVLDRAEWPANAPAGPDAMLRDFLERVEPLRQRWPAVRQIGVSIGGPMNPLTGVILGPPHLPGWDDVPLGEILRRELDLEVAVEHDAAACLLAEWLWGAASGATHAIYLTCGTGCGAGILIGGRILRGPHGQSPEVGHVRLADDGPEAFGKRGCVESFCSGEGIGKLANYLHPGRFPEPTDTRTLHDLAEAGDACARDVLETAARRTGQLCSMLADVFSPEVIVLGSLARYFGPWWLELVRQEFPLGTLPVNGGHTRIVPAALGAKLQDLSAVAPCIFRSLEK